jgi:hypothetical protein
MGIKHIDHGNKMLLISFVSASSDHQKPLFELFLTSFADWANNEMTLFLLKNLFVRLHCLVDKILMFLQKAVFPAASLYQALPHELTGRQLQIDS